MSNKTLTSLTFHASQADLEVLAQVLGSNSTCLKHLCLESIHHENASNVLYSLRFNTSLSSLKLKYNMCAFPDSTWEALLLNMPHLITLERLEAVIPVESFGTSNGENLAAVWARKPNLMNKARDTVDNLAVALAENSSLVSTKIIVQQVGTQQRCDMDYLLNFVCRLYSRRNCVRRMIAQGHMTPELWPAVLESLRPNPSVPRTV